MKQKKHPLKVVNFFTAAVIIIGIFAFTRGNEHPPTAPLSHMPPVNLGLTHRYSFKRNAKDAVGNAHGKLQGHAVVKKGKVILDGSDGTYINLPGGSITGYTAVTFECWLDIGENGNYARIFDMGSMNGKAGQHDLYLCADHTGTHDWRLMIMDPQPKSKTIEIKGDLSNRGYIYLAGVFDTVTGFMGLYADGKLIGSRNDLTSLSSVDPDYFFLGRSLFAADSYLKGEFDEFRIYNTALSSAQIAANFANGPDAKLSKR